MPAAFDRLVVKLQVSHFAAGFKKNPAVQKMSFWIIPPPGWDDETFGKGIALELMLNF